MRRGIDKTVYFTITRDRIPMTTVDVAYMIRPSVGYVKIESFGENTYKELMVALEKAKSARHENPFVRPSRQWRRIFRNSRCGGKRIS